MSIDVLELRDRTFDTVLTGLSDASDALRNITLLEGVCVFVGVGLLLGAVEWHRRWVKGKGLRMATAQRSLKLRSLMADYINDAVLQAEANGEISGKEARRIMRDFADKLHYTDLIPKERSTKMVKNKIKSRLAHGVAGPSHPIPGKPEAIVRTKFRVALGNVSKFFKA